MTAASLRLLLPWLVFLPLASAGVVFALGRPAKRIALALALVHVGLTALLVTGARPILADRTATSEAGKLDPHFVPGDPTRGEGTGPQRTAINLLSLPSRSPTGSGGPGPNVQFFLGVDGINLWLVALASVMLVASILVSWDGVRDRPGAYYAWLFVLQAGAVGAFLSFDVILFYVFFELTLIPSFFLIGKWGTGSGRRDAARKFFLYTLGGSLLTLVGVIGVVLANPLPNGDLTFSVPDLMANVSRSMSAAAAAGPEALAAKKATQAWLFVAIMAGFAVKTPIWPFHTWLPGAYSEAPPGVTMLLSSLLAKLGTFGILRFALALTPDAALEYGLPAFGTLAGFGIIYAALCAFAQRDVKLMVAYSSVSHLGFLVLGLFAFNAEGLAGATLHMVNHGLSTGALFALTAFLLDRYKTSDMTQFGGLIGRFPLFAFFAFALCFASIGLPGLNNFASEMLMMGGLFDARNPGSGGVGLAVVAAVGIFLSAWYVLSMLRRVFFQPLKEPMVPDRPTDATWREKLTLGGLLALCLALGLFPQMLLKPMAADVAALAAVGDAARARAGK